MGCVSTISVFGLLGSTLPNSLRAMPGLKSLVSFESMTNCSTFLGNAVDLLAFQRGHVIRPDDEIVVSVESRVLALLQYLERRGTRVIELCAGGWAKAFEPTRTAIPRHLQKLDHKIPRRFRFWRAFTTAFG